MAQWMNKNRDGGCYWRESEAHGTSSTDLRGLIQHDCKGHQPTKSTKEQWYLSMHLKQPQLTPGMTETPKIHSTHSTLLVFPPLSEADKFHFEWVFDWFLLIVFHVTWPSPSCFFPNLSELGWEARFPWCNPQGGTNASISWELHTIYGFHRFLWSLSLSLYIYIHLSIYIALCVWLDIWYT